MAALGAAKTPAPDFVLQHAVERPEPFAESRLQLNPPTFRWPEIAGATAYRIELSPSADFVAGLTQSETVRELFFRPLQPLARGSWFWRYRSEAPQPGAWSAPVDFEIGGRLADWPLAPWRQYLDAVPAEHPRVYLNRAEWQALPEKAALLGPALERWRERIRGRLAGPFSLAPYLERAGVADGHVPTTMKERKLVIWESKAAAAAAIRPAAEGAWLWAATGERWFLEAARARALQVAGFDPHGFISERNPGADDGNLDFGNAVLVHDLGVVYDLLHGELTPAERATIRAAIVVRAAPMFAKMHRAPLRLMRAHAWQHAFLDALVGALAVYGEEPAARGWVELGLKSFVALYPWFGGNDGGSHEGIKYYYGLEMIPSLQTLDVFRTAFGLRLDEGNPWFRASAYSLIYAFPPGSLRANLGDGDAGEDDEVDNVAAPGGKGRLAARRMAELFGNPHAAAYADAVPEDDHGVTFADVLRWAAVPRVAPVPLATLPAARLFRDTGTVFTHSRIGEPDENVRLIFKSSPYGGHGHGHADQNSFHLFAYNEELLLDSGYYTPTGDPHRQKWTVQTRAHNTILVDGTGQPWGNTRGHGRISHFEQHNDWVYMVGSAATAYREMPLERFDRHIVWLRRAPEETYVIVDDLAAGGGTPRRFDWLLHAAERMEIDAAAQRVHVRGAKGEARLSFVVPAGLSFDQHDRFDAPARYWRNGKDYPLPNQWHLTASTRRVPATQFVTVIQVAKRGAPMAAFRNSAGVLETGGYRVKWDDVARCLKIERTLPLAGPSH